MVDPRISELILIVRKPLEEWTNSKFAPKVTYIQKESFESYEDVKDQLKGVDAFVCALGSRVKHGEATFVKVDYEYPLVLARLAKELGVPHYGICSSMGANANSCLLYMRTKGRVEQDLKTLFIPSLTIYQPGVIANRDGDKRCGESFLACCCPCVTKISGADLGQAMFEHTIARCQPGSVKNELTLTNAQILADLKNNTKQK